MKIKSISDVRLELAHIRFTYLSGRYAHNPKLVNEKTLEYKALQEEYQELFAEQLKMFSWIKDILSQSSLNIPKLYLAVRRLNQLNPRKVKNLADKSHKIGNLISDSVWAELALYGLTKR